MSLEQQFITLFIIMGSSLFIGILFDGYRVFKSRLDVPSWAVFLIDMSFGIFSALFIFRLLLWTNHGQLRLVIIVAFFLGLWIYYIRISKIFIHLWLLFYHLLYRGWIIIIRIFQLLIMKPIILLYKLGLMIIISLVSLFYSIYGFLQRFITVLSKGVYSKSKGTGRKLKSKVIKKAGFSLLLKKIFKR